MTRKGVSWAGAGEYGLIPVSIGTGSYVVRGLGNEASYCSASGAGRRISRTRAKKTFTLDDLAAQTAGVECRKDAVVLDEIHGAYKDLESVIEAQTDLADSSLGSPPRHARKGELAPAQDAVRQHLVPADHDLTLADRVAGPVYIDPQLDDRHGNERAFGLPTNLRLAPSTCQN